jgi:hypothetical protein
MKTTPSSFILLALVALLSAEPAPAAKPAGVGRATSVLPFIADDYPRALEEARQRKLPIFIEAWAPW